MLTRILLSIRVLNCGVQFIHACTKKHLCIDALDLSNMATAPAAQSWFTSCSHY